MFSNFDKVLIRGCARLIEIKKDNQIIIGSYNLAQTCSKIKDNTNNTIASGAGLPSRL